MTDTPRSLQELLRRALAAQMEMGIGEIVVNPRRMESAAVSVETSTEKSRVVGVEEAITRQGEGAGWQSSMGLMENAQYETLEAHFQAIRNCTKCNLCQTRNKFVYGVGHPSADLMFVGEAPGAEEDKQGEPFVGRAGQLLDKIFSAMGLERKQVYIANILKCRPPNNRDPQPDEMEQCFPHLSEQIRLIRPKLMCALGRISAQALLRTTTPLGKLRGRWHEFEGVPLRVTYHPAALLRFPQYKKETWVDMQEIMTRLQELNNTQKSK